MIWYDKPAKIFTEAIPLGNGELGAMIYGGKENKISLNLDTYWSGYPRDTAKEVDTHLDDIRNLFIQEEYVRGQEEIEKKLLGPDTQAYLPVGNLAIHYLGEGEFSNYRRELRLNEACFRETFTFEEHAYEVISFISHVDKGMLFKIEGTGPYINLEINVSSPFSVSCYYDQDRFGMEKETLGESEELSFCLGGKIISDGEIIASPEGIKVLNGQTIILHIAGETNYGGFQQPFRTDYTKRVERLLNSLSIHTYEALYARHVEDYQRLYNRVSFQLDDVGEYKKPIDERLRDYRFGEPDYGLIPIYFQYGRYLMISSSREGSQPMNLQGIWNEYLTPPWRSNYTININLPMNYWPATVCNLFECNEPLLRFIQEVAISGQQVAKKNYGCSGFTVHHNSDLWRLATPVEGEARWAFWPMGGAWLVSHLWEHFLYTKEQSYLEEFAYPIMKEALLFLIDWMQEDDKGQYYTIPSTSPENGFVTKGGKIAYVAKSTTMDITLIRECISNCIQAAKVLQTDEKLIHQWQGILCKLPGFLIGSEGQLLEWHEEFEEEDRGHRHLSHLYGVFPGNPTDHFDTITLEAAKKAMNRRLDRVYECTGWSCGWLLNLFARFKDKDLASEYLDKQVGEFTADNLMNAHVSRLANDDVLFQIDGNFGGIRGIGELLIQCYEGFVHLLPCLPKQFVTGSVTGLRVYDGLTVDMAWKDGVLVKASVYPTQDGECSIYYEQDIQVLQNSNKILVTEKEGVLSFQVEKGQTYDIFVTGIAN